MPVVSILTKASLCVPRAYQCTGEEEEWGITDMMEALGATPHDSEGPISPYIVRHDIHPDAHILSADPDIPDEVSYTYKLVH